MNENFLNFKIRPSRAIAFLSGMLLIMLIMGLSDLKINPYLIVSDFFHTQIESHAPIFQKIKPKLFKTSANILDIKQDSGIVESANAGSIDENAAAYIVVDEDSGQVLAQKNADKKLPIASLTKIMSAVVALDLSKQDELFKISSTAANESPTRIGVVPGQKMKVSELLDAALMTSANDAAQVLKEGVNSKYNSPVFVAAMNEKAIFLGLSNTHFDNPQGFDSSRNFSSAKDLAVLAHYALSNYPLIAQTTQKDYQFLPADSNHKQFDLYNWNGLLDVYPGVRGVKIGNTDSAGTTTIVSSVRNGKKVLVVILGAPDILNRDLLASKLLDLGFEKLANLPPVNVTSWDLLAKYQTWKYFN